MNKLRILLFAIFIFSIFSLCYGAEPEAAKDAKSTTKKEEKANNGSDQICIKLDKIIVVADPESVSKINAVKKTEDTDGAPVVTSDFLAREVNVGDLKQGFVSRWNTFVSWDGFAIWKLLYLACGLSITFIAMFFSRLIIEAVIGSRLAGSFKNELTCLISREMGKPLGLFMLSLGLYMSFMPVVHSLPRDIYEIIDRVFMALSASAIAWGLYRMVAVLDFILSKKYDVVFSGFDDLLINIIRKTLKVIIVIMSILFIGQNILGLNITAILAGAGVAGLAVAFAAQDSIANFFGSIMIAVDKPFKVGDEIITDGVDGIVVNLGFRSILLRTPNGHMVTIPNKIAANTKIENVTRKPYMKFTHDLTLAYGTKPDKLEQAMKILNEIYENHPGLTPAFPPRIYFNKFNEFALNINITIWMYSMNSFDAQEWNSNANIRILRLFNEAGIEFASPSLMDYLNKVKNT